MHAALGQFSTAEAREADFVSADAIVAAASLTARAEPEPPYQPSVYHAPRMRGSALTIVVVIHAVLLALLGSLGFDRVIQEKRAPLVINVIDLPSIPPPEAPRPPDQPTPIKPVQPQIVAPPPILSINRPVSPVQAAPVAPPPAPAPAPAPPAGPVSASDLATSMVSAAPPKYPLESRRRHEAGTVVLTVLVGTSGAVEQVSIAKSSGFSRLDKAALDAVRRWRWSPVVRNGLPVMVKGYVDIPFVLT